MTISASQHFSGKVWIVQRWNKKTFQNKLSHLLFNAWGEIQLRKNLSSFCILKTNREKCNIFSRIFIHVLYIKIRKIQTTEWILVSMQIMSQSSTNLFKRCFKGESKVWLLKNRLKISYCISTWKIFCSA